MREFNFVDNLFLDYVGIPHVVSLSTWSLGHGDGTLYKNNLDFHSYSSEKRFRDEEYLFFNQFSSWFEGNFWNYL